MLNLGSYNYLGFADDWGATCKKGVMPVLDALPVGCSINRRDFGESAGGEIRGRLLKARSLVPVAFFLTPGMKVLYPPTLHFVLAL